MSRFIGGSWDGVERRGLPSGQRKLVLNKRLPDGSQDPSASETYFRRSHGGPWRFWHDGETNDSDGPWYFVK